MPVCPCLAHTVANRASVSCWSSCVSAVPTSRLVFSESTLGHSFVGFHCHVLFTWSVCGPDDNAGAPVISRRPTRPAQWYALLFLGRTCEVSLRLVTRVYGGWLAVSVLVCRRARCHPWLGLVHVMALPPRRRGACHISSAVSYVDEHRSAFVIDHGFACHVIASSSDVLRQRFELWRR